PLVPGGWLMLGSIRRRAVVRRLPSFGRMALLPPQRFPRCAFTLERTPEPASRGLAAVRRQAGKPRGRRTRFVRREARAPGRGMESIHGLSARLAGFLRSDAP